MLSDAANNPTRDRNARAVRASSSGGVAATQAVRRRDGVHELSLRIERRRVRTRRIGSGRDAVITREAEQTDCARRARAARDVIVCGARRARRVGSSRIIARVAQGPSGARRARAARDEIVCGARAHRVGSARIIARGARAPNGARRARAARDIIVRGGTRTPWSPPLGSSPAARTLPVGHAVHVPLETYSFAEHAHAVLAPFGSSPAARTLPPGHAVHVLVETYSFAEHAHTVSPPLGSSPAARTLPPGHAVHVLVETK